VCLRGEIGENDFLRTSRCCQPSLQKANAPSSWTIDNKKELTMLSEYADVIENPDFQPLIGFVELYTP
jgi:hypothetical protein